MLLDSPDIQGCLTNGMICFGLGYTLLGFLIDLNCGDSFLTNASKYTRILEFLYTYLYVHSFICSKCITFDSVLSSFFSYNTAFQLLFETIS